MAKNQILSEIDTCFSDYLPAVSGFVMLLLTDYDVFYLLISENCLFYFNSTCIFNHCFPGRVVAFPGEHPCTVG